MTEFLSLLSDSDEEVPGAKRQKMGVLDELDSSDDEEVPDAEELSDDEEVQEAEEMSDDANVSETNSDDKETSWDDAIVISSSDECGTSDSDIDEGKDIWIVKDVKAPRFAPPKKIMSVFDAMDFEEEEKCYIVKDLRINNLAMPNPNVKTGVRHPVPVWVDRSVAEFFYKRDAVPKGPPFTFQENMPLDLENKKGLLFKLAASERKEDPTKNSFLWYVMQLYDVKYLPYHEMTRFSLIGENDMRDKSNRHFGIPPFPREFRCGCSCEDGCRTMKCECRRRSVIANSRQKRVFQEDYWNKDENFFGYDANGLLTAKTLKPPQGLKKLPTRAYSECNSSCRCHDNKIRYCFNSMTSANNPRYKTELFLTKEKGWGLRAAENIPAGAYITEYTGVVQPNAHYIEFGESEKSRFNQKNAVEILDSYFRESLTLHPKGEQVNKFNKDIAKKNLNNDLSRRKYEFVVDPIYDIVRDYIEKKKENPLNWLLYKMDDREEIVVDEDEQNSSELLKEYAYDQAYYGSFTIDAALYGNESRFINGCCHKEYSNVEIVLIEDERQDQRFPKVTFFTCKEVKAGEEFEYFYGYDKAEFDNGKKYYECKCNGCQTEENDEDTN